MKKISNNILSNRYLVIIDTFPNTGPVEGCVAYNFRNRTLNCVSLKTFERVVALVNLMTTEMRKAMLDPNVKRPFRWGLVLVDRMTGEILTTEKVSGWKVSRPNDPNSNVNVYADWSKIPEAEKKTLYPPYFDSPEGRDVLKVKVLWRRLKHSNKLQPTLITGEDPLAWMMRNNIMTKNWTAEVAPGGNELITKGKAKDDFNWLNVSALTYGLFDGQLPIPKDYPKSLQSNLDKMYTAIDRGFDRLRRNLVERATTRLSRTDSRSQLDMYALKLSRVYNTERDNYHIQSVMAFFLEKRIDFNRDAEVDQALLQYHDQTFHRSFEIAYADENVKSLYISRKVVNSEDIHDWMREQGFVSALPLDELHTTQLYCKDPVDWHRVHPDPNNHRVETSNNRRTKYLGDGGAFVLNFESRKMESRQTELLHNGATSKFIGFVPHITLSYKGVPSDLALIKPYMGPIILGPERMEEIKDDFDPNSITETVL